MAETERKERRWLRPLGLVVLVLALSVNEPLVLVGLPFVLLSFLTSSGRAVELFVAALVAFLVFTGDASGGLWHLERGWAIVTGGGFVALTLRWPRLPFMERALGAVGGGALWSGVVLAIFDGWNVADDAVATRIEAGAASTMEAFRAVTGGDAPPPALTDAVRQTAEIQVMLFPGLLALASLAALGVAWWAHLRLSAGSDGGLGPLAGFRFPDALIWVLIGGLVLVLASSGWAAGWGRVGANLALVMGGLYALRGAGVVLSLTGGLTLANGVLVALAAVLAPPLLVGGAMVVGIGDTWFDLRARWRRGGTDRD